MGLMRAPTNKVPACAAVLALVLLPAALRAAGEITDVNPKQIGLGGTLSVTVSPDYFNAKAKTASDRSHLFLFLNGVRIPDAHPVQVDPQKYVLTFHLTR